MDLTNKKILVTGADGFIGSHLVERLVAKGADVRAFVFYNFQGRNGWLDSLADSVLKSVEIVSGDIRDPNGVFQASANCDVIMHLAALIGIPFSYHSPDSYIDTNIKGTLNILNAARIHNTTKVVITSTSEVYGTALYVPIDENHPLQGQSPYSASKIGADQLALSFYRSFHTPVTIIRPFNTYGPRQSARAVIPSLFVQLMNGKKDLSVGNLNTTRDFTFVTDTVEGFIKIVEAENVLGEVVNLGVNSEISVKDLLEKISHIVGVKANIIISNERIRPKNSEVERLWSNNQKAKQLINWSPSVLLEKGLQMTYNWFLVKENMQLYNSNRYYI
ncbi:MAG: SDR family NAD(P)-dependent oxidoreductase [Melioribacteraceae bacterium]